MKGCFVLQRRFAYIGHELAKFLKEAGVVDEFCGYVQVRDGYRFLKSQREIPYTALLLDEDIQKKYLIEKIDQEFLEQFEKDYGSPERYINVDRIISRGQLVREYPYSVSPFTREERLRMVQVFAKDIAAFLDTEKPDFVFGYIFGGMGTLLLHEMARKRGIRILTAIVPSTRDLVTVSERYDRLTFVEEAVAHNKATPLKNIPGFEQATKYVQEFRARPFAYNKVVMSREKKGPLAQFTFLTPRLLLWSLYYNFFISFGDYFRDREKRSDYSTVNPFYHLYDIAARKLRNLRGVEDLYDPFEPDKQFVFFPLQYEPETSLLLLAPHISDQVELIKRIAASLPEGMLLYVKEHPAMVPYRPRAYYKRLKATPSVRLMDPSIRSFDLIKRAKIVTLINGTPGWEATLLGKPVITFGDIFYNALSFIGRGDPEGELRNLITKQLSVPIDEEELLRYLAALFEDSAVLDLMYVWEEERDAEKKRQGLANFADVLGRKITSQV